MTPNEILHKFLEEVTSEYIELSKKEKTELVEKAIRGDKEAQTKLIKGHLPLAISIATRFKKKYNVDLNRYFDFISCANLELCKSVSEIEKIKGLKNFSGYIGKSIDRAIKREIAENRIPRIPYKIYWKSKKFFSIILNNSEIKREELLKQMGLKETKKHGVDRQINLLIRVGNMSNLLSLDSSVLTFDSSDKKIPLSDIIKDSSDLPFVSADKQLMLEKLYRALKTTDLTDAQKMIIEMRFNFNKNVQKPPSFTSIGRKLNLSHATVYGYYKEALEKIKLSIIECK